MAESKKKSVAKKSVKNTEKSVNVAENSSSNKVSSTKNAKSKKSTKNVVKKSDKKPVSKQVKEESNSWLIAAIVLGLVVIILVAVVGVMYFNDSKNNPVVEENNGQVPVSGDAIELLIVEDSSCINCQVDLFVSQVKDNLIPNLDVRKVDFDSAEGKKIIADLKVNQVPVYLFGESIDKREDWAEQLAGAFLKVSLNGKSYYLLNPQFIPNKVLVEEPLVTSTAMYIGDKNAPVTIIEFSDYECPFCAIAEGNADLVTQFRAQNPTYVPPMPDVIKNYVETGKVRVVFYNFPIASLHPQARIVHNAVLCSNEQGEYKDYSAKIWESRSEWSSATVNRADTLKKYAKELGLDTVKFNACLDSKKYDKQIDEEMALGQTYGVSGTPAFFIGKTFISGAQDYSTFEAIIESQLNE